MLLILPLLLNKVFNSVSQCYTNIQFVYAIKYVTHNLFFNSMRTKCVYSNVLVYNTLRLCVWNNRNLIMYRQCFFTLLQNILFIVLAFYKFNLHYKFIKIYVKVCLKGKCIFTFKKFSMVFQFGKSRTDKIIC